MSGPVIDLLSRPTYAFGQVDRLLGLRGGTARRWIDGYRRGDKRYAPVVRDRATGEETATWGEFVETRLLSEYRDAGVPLIRMRPVIELLRERLNTQYPLASARTWVWPNGRELVHEVQERVGLERRLALVELRTGQTVPSWSDEARDFERSIEWASDGDDPQPARIRPFADLPDVIVDPLRGFGEPVVRGVRTEVISELYRAGDSLEMIAELYELKPSAVNAALRYELKVAS